MPSRRLTLFTVAVVSVATLWYLSRAFTVGHYLDEISIAPPPLVLSSLHGTTFNLDAHPIRYSNIAMASSFVYHYDVYMAFAQTVGMALTAAATLDPGLICQIHIFAQDFGWGYDKLMDELGIWQHRGVRRPHKELIEHLDKNTGDGAIDMVVFGTCEYDIPEWHDELVKSWEKRDRDHKFKVVCVVHDARDDRFHEKIGYWQRRGAIHILAIGDHVAKEFREIMAKRGDRPDLDTWSVGFEHVPVEVHVPTLNLTTLPTKSGARTLSKAVIQGMFERGRDYPRFFKDLTESLHENPSVWGYQPLGSGSHFLADQRQPSLPFQLLLVGSGNIDIPPELVNIVSVHRGLNYTDFFALLADTDIIVPAFVDESYLVSVASSTVNLAVEVNVPLLVTERMRRAYGYIDDDRAVITRPAAMPEVHALRALRTGDAAPFLRLDPAKSGVRMGDMPPIRREVERMMQRGWLRTRKQWDEYKTQLWNENRIVAEKVLRDLR